MPWAWLPPPGLFRWELFLQVLRALRPDIWEEAILCSMAALSLSPVRQGKLRIVDTDLKSKPRPSISPNRLK